MNLRGAILAAGSAWLVAAAAHAAATPATDEVFGAREHVVILGDRPLELTASLQPSAPVSRLQTRDMKYRVDAAGRTWVRFEVDAGDVITTGHATFERPVIEDLRRRQPDGSWLHVPVVKLEICVGDRRLAVPFRLRQRRGYTPPMTLGAPVVRRLGQVDPRAAFLHEPRCPTLLPAGAASTRRGGLTLLHGTDGTR